MRDYTALTSFTLFVRIDDILVRNYERLPEVIATLPAPALLRELEIHIPYEAATVTPGPLDCLEHVDDILFGAGLAETVAKFNTDDTTGAARETQRFDALAQLRVVLLTSGPLSETERTKTDWGARLHLPRAAARGRLEVRFGRDQRYVLAHARVSMGHPPDVPFSSRMQHCACLSVPSPCGVGLGDTSTGVKIEGLARSAEARPGVGRDMGRSGRFVVRMTRVCLMAMCSLAIVRTVWFVPACYSSGNVGRVMKGTADLLGLRM